MPEKKSLQRWRKAVSPKIAVFVLLAAKGGRWSVPLFALPDQSFCLRAVGAGESAPIHPPGPYGERRLEAFCWFQLPHPIPPPPFPGTQHRPAGFSLNPTGPGELQHRASSAPDWRPFGRPALPSFTPIGRRKGARLAFLESSWKSIKGISLNGESERRQRWIKTKKHASFPTIRRRSLNTLPFPPEGCVFWGGDHFWP